MKSILVTELSGLDALTYTDHTIDSPSADRVLIDVAYCGVNFPDILITKGKYQFQPELPFSPGGEVAGTISKVGQGVTHLQPGDRVVSGTTWGGFAEQALGYAFNTHKIPDGVSLRDASSILMTHGTMLHALKDRAQLKKEETVVVLGASGGIGTAAIRLGKIMGAKVIAFTSTAEKAQFCKETAGADEAYTYTEKSLKTRIKEVTYNKGADVIIDPIGGDYTEQAFRGIAVNGCYLVVGFASGSVPSISLNLPLLKSASIVGAFWGSFFRNFPEKNMGNVALLMQWLSSGSLSPIIDKIYPLCDAKQALQTLTNREVKGKILLKV